MLRQPLAAMAMPRYAFDNACSDVQKTHMTYVHCALSLRRHVWPISFVQAPYQRSAFICQNDRITLCDVVSAASCHCTHEFAAKYRLLYSQHAWHAYVFLRC